MKATNKELLVRLDEKIDAIKEDITELKEVEKRVRSLEKFSSYAKGGTAIIAGVVGYLLKVLHIGGNS